MTIHNEILVPLDLSDAIAVIERQDEQIAMLKADLRAAYDKVSELLGDRTVLTAENKRLRAIMTEHAGKCRGWFGENSAWEIEMFPEEVLLREGAEEQGKS